MKKRVIAGLVTTAALATTIFLVPFGNDKATKFEQFQDVYATTVDQFYDATLTIEVKAGTDVVYEEVVVLEKNEDSCDYQITTKELSDSLYGDLYDITTDAGEYTIEETLYYFAPTLNLKDSEIDNYKEAPLGTNEEQIEFVVTEKNINEGFGFEEEANVYGNVSFVATIENDLVTYFSYSYSTKDGMVVTIKCLFVNQR